MKIIKNCFDDDLSERSDMPIMGIPMPDNLRREFGSKREALAREFRNLYEKTSENKKLSKETSKRFDELTAKITAIDDRLARERQLQDWTEQGGSGVLSGAAYFYQNPYCLSKKVPPILSLLPDRNLFSGHWGGDQKTGRPLPLLAALPQPACAV